MAQLVRRRRSVRGAAGLRAATRRAGALTIGAGLCAAGLVVAGAQPASAATFAVNSLGDATDVSPGNGVCETGSGNGVCTLRAALAEATAVPGADTITVPSGTIAVGASYTVATDVQILGAGSTTVLDGGGSASVLRVTGGTVTIRNLVIEDGNDSSAGGGLYVSGGVVELTDATVRDNFAFTGGGGVYVGAAGTLTVRRTSVIDNNATGAFGGGFWNQGVLWVWDSLIAGNDSNRAGGIRNDENLNLRNVTVSGNTVHSPENGTGGISQNGFAFLNNVTVTDNTGIGNDPASFRGGGIQTTAGETTVMKNSIVWGNDGGTGPDDCVGQFSADSRYNLLGDTTGCTLPGVTTTWVLGADPQLGPLTNNGGPTRSHLPAFASPAVNAGAPVQAGGPAADACEGTDQRGVLRLDCDMGAVEREIAVPATLLVDTPSDGADAVPGDGFCATAAGLCTLRAAVQESNGLPGRQTISVGPGVHNLTIPSAGEGGIDPAAAGDLDLTDDVTIAGAEAALTVVDANDHSRAFEVAPLVDADLSRLTVRDGTDSSGGGISVVTATLTLDDVVVEHNVSTGAGGGIGTTGIDEVVVVTNSVIRNNTASFGDGGGIDASGTVVVEDSVVSGNTASFAGGGLRLTGDAEVRRTTVSGNTTLAGPLSNGGGISAFGLTLDQSTVSGNTSGGHGGGLFASGSVVRNTTISGNTATTEGGGVSTSGTLQLVHATLSGNEAGDEGGGTFVFGSGAQLSLRNSIVHDPGPGAECSGATPTSLGGNVARDASCGLGAAGDLPGTDPLLNPLADNGGPTLTHLPATGSPVVDTAADAGVAVDQRNVARPQGGAYDIGAVEGSGASAAPSLDALASLVTAYNEDGTVSDATTASLRYSLSRAQAQAATGSEVRTITYLRQFVARADNQVKGDARDDLVRALLVHSGQTLIAFYQALEDEEVDGI